MFQLSLDCVLQTRVSFPRNVITCKIFVSIPCDVPVSYLLSRQGGLGGHRRPKCPANNRRKNAVRLLRQHRLRRSPYSKAPETGPDGTFGPGFPVGPRAPLDPRGPCREQKTMWFSGRATPEAPETFVFLEKSILEN